MADSLCAANAAAIARPTFAAAFGRATRGRARRAGWAHEAVGAASVVRTNAARSSIAYGFAMNPRAPQSASTCPSARWYALVSRTRTSGWRARIAFARSTPCTLGIINPPVTIKNIEYSIIERGWDEGWVVPEAPKVRTGKKVAVIGSGPAGLSCAAQLNRAGHTVTVFERADRPGGLLMYGIPNMKLDKQEVVLRRIKLMEQEGIKFICNANVGENVEAEIFLKEYDATVICTGATQPRDLPIEGRNLKGVHFAMEFLTANTKAVLAHQASPINAAGKDVVVIGGGDTGTDCVGTSIRHGCKSLVQIEILPKPPLERAADNPWPEWPKTYKMDYGQEEAAAKFGADPRIYLTTVKKFVGDAAGNVKELVTVEIKWEKNEKGQFIPQEIPGTEKTRPAQLVLLAMGFLGPEQAILKDLALDTDPRSNIKAEHERYTTNLKGVFAAGDCRRGQSLVVWAINEGRGAARECDRYLMGSTDLP